MSPEEEEEERIAKLEARLRALEAIVNQLPQAVTQEILEAASHCIVSRRYRHPLAVADLGADRERELADESVNEVGRQMAQRPAS